MSVTLDLGYQLNVLNDIGEVYIQNVLWENKLKITFATQLVFFQSLCFLRVTQNALQLLSFLFLLLVSAFARKSKSHFQIFVQLLL